MRRAGATGARRGVRLALPALVALTMAAACGDDGDTATGATLPTDAETAVTVEAETAGGTTTEPAAVDETADDGSTSSSTDATADDPDADPDGEREAETDADDPADDPADDNAESTPETDDDAGTETSGGTDDGSTPGSTGDGIAAVDWWGCWRAADAVGGGGGSPGDGGRVARVPNCATGPSSVGGAGDLSHPNGQPIFRATGAAGRPSIEFTFEGDTLLQTNGGSPWQGSDVLPSASTGVTLAWVGVTTDVNSHTAKYVVSGLNDTWRFPQLIIEGDGTNRFQGYAGGSVEVLSSAGTIADRQIIGVILHMDSRSGASSIEVNAGGRAGGQDSRVSADVAGLTLGNNYGRNFSTTDHQFVFLGLRQGELSEQEKVVFWDYVARAG